MTLPALSPPEARLAIATQSEDEDGRGVRLGFVANEAPHEAHCRFLHAGRPLRSAELTQLALDGEPLSGPRLFFLVRFWLATPEGIAADPAPFGRIDALPRI